MKIYLIAPRNPESFWTFDRVLPSLKKRCVFPNLSLPTVAGLTPPPHEAVHNLLVERHPFSCHAHANSLVENEGHIEAGNSEATH